MGYLLKHKQVTNYTTEENDFCRNLQLPEDSQDGQSFWSPSPIYNEMLTGPTSCSSCVGSHSCCEFRHAIRHATRRETFKAFLLILCLFLTFFTSLSSTLFAELWRRVIQMFYLQLDTQQSLIHCTLTTQRPGVLTVALCKQKFF